MRTFSYVLFAYAIIGTAVYSKVPPELRQDFYNIYTRTEPKAAPSATYGAFVHVPVPIDQVTFTLFNKDSSKNGTVITDSNLSLIKPTKDKIVFIVHGWTHQGDLPWVLNLKTAFLSTYPDSSVITVDWRKPARQPYSISAENTEDVGKFIGTMVLDLVKDHKVDMKRFLCVGHSLGGQICGFAGKKVRSVGKLLPRIFALDPAGPLFTIRQKNERLNPSDAEYVEVLHSNGGTFGFKDPCGTIDFFPNGGSEQPGCNKIDLTNIASLADPVSCPHERSFKYFTEAVRNPTDFEAKLCTTYNMFTKRCDESVRVSIGDLTTTLRGNFYLKTNSESPFSKIEGHGGWLGTVSDLVPKF